MALTEDIAATLDLSGYKCPLPVLKARKALKSLDPGSELTVICTDPAAPNDFRAYCQASGHVLLSIENDDDGYRIRLRRAS